MTHGCPFPGRNSLVQQKFNLLREESEGYSKLVTELTRSEVPTKRHDTHDTRHDTTHVTHTHP